MAVLPYRDRPRGDAVALLACAALAGALASVSPLATAVAGAIALFGFVRAGRRVLPLFALIVFAWSAWRASSAVAVHDRARDATIRDGPWPARVVVRGVVARSPVLLGDALRLDVDDPSRGLVSLHLAPAEAPALGRGDRIEAVAQVAPLDRFANEGAIDARLGHARRRVVLSGGAMSVVVVERGRGLGSLIDRARAHVRARIVATFTRDTNGMARALVLGEDDVADEDRRAFRKSGLAHLLAVSGMHLVLVVASFVGAFRALLARIPPIVARHDPTRLASAAGLPLVWMYCDLAGASGSAVRAAWMTTAALLARVLDRRPNGWRAAGLALAAVAIADPLAAFDLSFVLSALATAGLLSIAPLVVQALSRPKCPRAPWWVLALLACGSFAAPALLGVVAASLAAPPALDVLAAKRPNARVVLVRAFAATVAATIACTPLLALMAPDMPLGSVVANLVAVPVGEAAALPLCLAHALLAPFPAAERGCALAASGALAVVRAIARVFATTVIAIPLPNAAHLAVLAAGTAATLVARRFVRARTACIATVALGVVEVATRIRGAPHGMLRATFVDVAQGDAALVDLPDGAAMLVDGGGIVGSPVDVGERALVPLLRARRRRRLDVVVLSHPHPDHLLGLLRALEDVEVGALWDTGQGEHEGAGPAYQALLAGLRARGVPVLRPRDLCGARSVGGAAIDVLAPCPEVNGDRGPNDNSFVLRIRYGQRAFLFAGDAEHAEEAELVARSASSLRADVLKVGHHGSRTSSTPAFVEAVRPSLAIVSCGIRNRFGHPSAMTLETLVRSGARVLRTDREGAVVVRTDGASLDVE